MSWELEQNYSQNIMETFVGIVLTGGELPSVDSEVSREILEKISPEKLQWKTNPHYDAKYLSRLLYNLC